ncbi:MAG: hypothetical protein M3O32_00715 [Actinomycetota bacterium]|nr:hypothetical protein [Actinomycetota bacterium]
MRTVRTLGATVVLAAAFGATSLAVAGPALADGVPPIPQLPSGQACSPSFAALGPLGKICADY